jgi:heme/copper-type cytochrome/quinol oxidase subunit 4
MGKESASKLGRTAFVVGLALSMILTVAPAVLVPLLCQDAIARG